MSEQTPASSAAAAPRGAAVAFIFVTINLIVDLLYVAVDPRIRIAARPG